MPSLNAKCFIVHCSNATTVEFMGVARGPKNDCLSFKLKYVMLGSFKFNPISPTANMKPPYGPVNTRICDGFASL
jgi:hypothetical protein